MSRGTLSGSDEAGLSGKKARVSWLTPSAYSTDWPQAALPPAPDLPHQGQGGS